MQNERKINCFSILLLSISVCAKFNFILIQIFSIIIGTLKNNRQFSNFETILSLSMNWGTLALCNILVIKVVTANVHDSLPIKIWKLTQTINNICVSIRYILTFLVTIFSSHQSAMICLILLKYCIQLNLVT